MTFRKEYSAMSAICLFGRLTSISVTSFKPSLASSNSSGSLYFQTRRKASPMFLFTAPPFLVQFE